MQTIRNNTTIKLLRLNDFIIPSLQILLSAAFLLKRPYAIQGISYGAEIMPQFSEAVNRHVEKMLNC